MSKRRLQPLLLLLFTVVAFSCASARAPVMARTVRIGAVSHVPTADLAARYGLQPSVAPKQLTLSGGGRQLRLNEQRRDAEINAIQVSLSQPAQRQGRSWYVSETDYRLLLEPLFRPESLAKRRVKTIVLDPGHGGRDQGAAVGPVLEKEVTLRVATLLAERLRKAGYSVYLTRATDKTLELEDRPAYANRVKADLFLSIHINATANREIYGIETFLMTPRGTASTYSSTPLTQSQRNHGYDRYNARLAYDLHRNLLRRARGADRGIKHANFAVLRDSGCPAVLVELGFVTNSTERIRLNSLAYQTRLANALADGVTAYARSVGNP